MARLSLIVTAVTAVVALLGGFRYCVDTIKEMRLRKQRTGKWLLLGALCVMPSIAEAACSGASPTWTAADPSQAEVSACVSIATNGDTINIPAGSSTWNALLTIPNTKGLRIQGAGVGLTNITFGTCSGGALGHIEYYVSPGNAVSELSGISFTYSLTGCGSDAVNIYVKGHSTTANFRIHNNEFKNIRTRGIQFYTDSASADLYGLVDNNLFQTLVTGTSAHPLDFNGYLGGDGEMWERMGGAPDWGTEKFVYIEDNTFDIADMADNVFDAYAGSRFVFRNNTVYNTMPGVHGADSGGRRGVHSFELYRNTFTVPTGPNPFTAFNYRSGSILQWGNTWDSHYNEEGRLQVYRITIPDTYPPWGMCDGTHVFDRNGTPTGYQCLDQFGWRFDAGYKSTQAGAAPTLTPLYFWNNTQAGSAMAAPVVSGLAGYVDQNREFYTSTGASCTGGGSCTTGVGVGTSLPTTCTSGVAFWKTNEGNWDSNQAGTDGVLYTCTATNTWTLYYTPYLYPHPLRSSVDPQDPPSVAYATVARPFVIFVEWSALLLGVFWKVKCMPGYLRGMKEPVQKFTYYSKVAIGNGIRKTANIAQRIHAV